MLKRLHWDKEAYQDWYKKINGGLYNQPISEQLLFDTRKQSYNRFVDEFVIEFYDKEALVGGCMPTRFVIFN